ncbi:substrate-binding domain-containing protein [Acaryochloris sp. IP29b_bin.137]|uniref:PstS family phosphate ABC transporter substrate-binding protein n=1 Tax=Acaryochloris sp. IP29b_bin.137 TaxID=2969217 RepID=UPI00261927FE|nr:substrate-binding domain-containing protein [Acaryochloris sp. IP29b_bin.137]
MPIPLTTFDQADQVPSGQYYYSGSAVWSPIRLVVDSAIKSDFREFQLTYRQPLATINSATAIQMLISGEVAFAQSIRSLNEVEIQNSQQRGSELQQIPIAYDGIAVSVHPSLSISGLTFTQLAQIYCGRVTNWKDFGGPDLEIQPISIERDSGEMVDRFASQILKFRPFGQNLAFFSNATDAIGYLAETPGGILFGSAATMVPQCSIKPISIGRESEKLIPPYQEPLIEPSRCPEQRNQINAQAFQSQQYPLTQQLYVLFKSYPHNEYQAGQTYTKLLLSDQGQKLVTRAGFAPIKHTHFR